MQRLKRAIRKMAAIGTGVAMLGATMTGAIAQDLADYPSPFVGSNGVFDESTAIVVGDAAAASDTLGAIDIATNLQFMAKTPVSEGSGTVQVSGGVTEDVPIARGIANDTSYALDWTLDDADIDSFMDTTVQFQGKDYDVHDELVLRKDSPSVETSLTSAEDDYEKGVFLEVKKKSIYYYLFSDDSDLNLSKATSSEPFEVKFLGKTLKITDAAIVASSETKQERFTAYVGTEYFMDVGDVVTVEGKKVTLVNVGSGGSIIIDVEGTIDTIPAASTETVNGIEVTVDETFYANTKSERAASLIIGKDAEATYQDGDAYIGEDESNPNWEWSIGNLAREATTTLDTIGPKENKINFSAGSGPYVGVYNAFQADGDEDPALKGVGECYDLPNNYASICLDSLTVAEDNYLTLTIEYEAAFDLEDSGAGAITSNEKVIKISSDIKDTLKISSKALDYGNGTLHNADIETDTIYLAINGTGGATNKTGVFYKDLDDNKIRYIGSLIHDGAHAGMTEIALLNYKDTKDGNVNISFYNSSTTTAHVVLDILGDSTSELADDDDDIILNFTISGSDYASLGATISEAETGELIWKVPTSAGTNIGKKDEDHRGKYGIIIKDPESNGDSDRVVLEIPADQVQANIVIKGQAATVAGGSVSYIPADITIDTKLSSEVAGSESAHNLILVGGPCANPTVESVSSLGVTCSGWDMGAGEAVIKMASNGNKVALLVAGTDAVDTRMAAKVIGNYEDYDLSGDEVMVTGSISSPVLKVA